MNDDKQLYRIAKKLIETGEINRLEDLFPVVSKTTIARDLKLRPAKFNEYINNTGLFSLYEIEALANLIGIDYNTMYNIILQQYFQQKAAKEMGSK
jgi:hypothetical protein